MSKARVLTVKKNYILDTNVLLTTPIRSGVSRQLRTASHRVIEEIDRFKRESTSWAKMPAQCPARSMNCGRPASERGVSLPNGACSHSAAPKAQRNGNGNGLYGAIRRTTASCAWPRRCRRRNRKTRRSSSAKTSTCGSSGRDGSARGGLRKRPGADHRFFTPG